MIFRSPVFSTEAPREGEVQYDVPLGDDLAGVVGRRVHELAPDIEAPEAVREDWGTTFDLLPPGERYCVDVNWLGYRYSEDTWGLRITNDTPVGCLGSPMGKTPPAVHQARVLDLVAAVLAADPTTFLAAEWLSLKGYQERIE